MVKNPRYDPEEDVSRHAATSPEKCKEMKKNHGWDLVDIEEISVDAFKVDCVFKGKTEFPKSYHDKEKD